MHNRLAPSMCALALVKPVCRASHLSATSHAAADMQEMRKAELSILWRHKCTAGSGLPMLL